MDYVLRMSAGEGSVRAFFAYTKNTAEAARKTHSLSPVAAAALGRMLTAGAIMGVMLKNDEDILTIIAKGDGPLGGIVVTADNKVGVKGYVYEPRPELPLKQNGKLDVGGALGLGSLTVIKDMGLKEPVSGQVKLVSGEIAEDMAYYFAASEQIPSAVALGVLVDVDYSVKQAGGLVIQIMPGACEEIISEVEKKVGKMDFITNMLEKGLSPEEIMESVLGGAGIKFYEKTPISFSCNCGRERAKKALLSVGRAELSDMLNTDKKANIHCHFCNSDYNFSEDELKEMLASLNYE